MEAAYRNAISETASAHVLIRSIYGFKEKMVP